MIDWNNRIIVSLLSIPILFLVWTSQPGPNLPIWIPYYTIPIMFTSWILAVNIIAWIWGKK